MYKLSLIVTVSLIGLHAFSQGKYAGSMKKIIGSSYLDKNDITALRDWEYREGSLVTPVHNPETIVVNVFQKEKTWIAFFSIKEDTLSSAFTIMDVVEVKNVQQGWWLKTTFCRQHKIENIEIIALVKLSATQQYLKPAKMAWRFNRDKRRFEMVSSKGIDCLN